MGKYLPGLSYGMSGGPPPLSWGGRPTQEWIREYESGEGEYTFDIHKGNHVLGQVTFMAVSLRSAQETAKALQISRGGSYASHVRYVGDHPGK